MLFWTIFKKAKNQFLNPKGHIKKQSNVRQKRKIQKFLKIYCYYFTLFKRIKEISLFNNKWAMGGLKIRLVKVEIEVCV